MNTFNHSPLALTILALLREEPMHPYRMQQLIKNRGKDEVIKVRHRASFYQTINQLVKYKLIKVRKTSRDGNRPERTIYEITDKGKQSAKSWMESMLSSPVNEYPMFPAALAHLQMLTPDEAAVQLNKRMEKLDRELSGMEDQLKQVRAWPPRLFLIETEYVRAMKAMERTWIKSLLDDLENKRLTWDEEWLHEIAGKLDPE